MRILVRGETSFGSEVEQHWCEIWRTRAVNVACTHFWLEHSRDFLTIREVGHSLQCSKLVYQGHDLSHS